MKTDTQLIEEIKEGDQGSLELLYKKYFSRLSRFVIQITQDSQEALDVINEVFMTVWTDASKFRGDSSLSSWIMGIAYNKSLATIRKRRHWLSFSNELDAELVDNSEVSSDYDDMRKVMKKLSPQQRAMMELTYFFGYSYEEIGNMLSCKSSVVRHQLFTARKHVRSMMGEFR